MPEAEVIQSTENPLTIPLLVCAPATVGMMSASAMIETISMRHQRDLVFMVSPVL